MDKCTGPSCIICLEKVLCERCHVLLSRHSSIPRVYFDFTNKYDKSRLSVSYSCPVCGQILKFTSNKN
jgi:hypothetical protein